jgi:hypothetical protein
MDVVAIAVVSTKVAVGGRSCVVISRAEHAHLDLLHAKPGTPLEEDAHATLDVLNEQLSQDYAPRVAAKDCRTADEAAAHMQRLDHVSVLVLHGERLVNVCEHTGGHHLRTQRHRHFVRELPYLCA